MAPPKARVYNVDMSLDALAKLAAEKAKQAKPPAAAKVKKDPNAPKRPRSSYIYFCNDKRSEIKEANPEMSPQAMSKELGRMWSEDYADEEKRKKWNKLAAKDKTRYDTEMESYTPPESSENEDTTVPQKKGR